jgi:flagellar FliL protein
MEEPSLEQLPEQSEQPQADSPKKSPRRIFLIIGLAVVALAGAGGFLFLRRAKAATPRAEEPAPAEVKAILHLETFTVNMNDPEQKTYLRIGIDLGLSSAPKGEGKGPAPTALVRDTILSILTAAKPEEVTNSEGKKQLKERLLEALQQRAPELEVREVYFTEFLMQR